MCFFYSIILQKIKISMLVFNAIKFTCLLLDFNVSGEDIKVGMIQNYFRYIPKHSLKLSPFDRVRSHEAFIFGSECREIAGFCFISCKKGIYRSMILIIIARMYVAA